MKTYLNKKSVIFKAWPKILTFCLGASAIAIAFLADFLLKGTGLEASSIGLAKKGVLGGGIILIIVGFFSVRINKYILPRLFILMIFTFVLDNVLYQISPFLPRNLNEIMSYESRKKYWIANKVYNHLDYLGDIWFYKPNSLESPKEGLYDELGYNNPLGYISEADGMDVLVLGDSFIESGEIVENLRKALRPLSVYSISYGGQTIPHWRSHFKRYKNSSFYNADPKVVILNFSGNDIDEFAKYQIDPSVPEYLKETSEIRQWPKKKISFYREIGSIIKEKVAPKVVSTPMQMEGVLSSEANALFRKDLLKTVNTIRESDEDTKIIFSYIPSPGAVYIGKGDHCEKRLKEIFPSYEQLREACKVSPIRQEVLSKKMRKISSELNLYYVDPIDELREASKADILFKLNDAHLSDKGYEVYSSVLAKKVDEILKDGK